MLVRIWSNGNSHILLRNGTMTLENSIVTSYKAKHIPLYEKFYSKNSTPT